MGPSKPPTKMEREWMEAAVRYGCLACILDGYEPRPTAYHHIVAGGRRLGHLYGIGLCDPGHHQNGEPFGLLSVHPYKARFEAKYGTQLQLLAELKKRLGIYTEASYQ